ncbi:hypothetical protein T4C_3863 [Trichinella pseudospiralis]|uniref:Uncharacterized protein n=1 Tax=Trichinella pseudospiralis TaxID=6337 RepID=A0A0V1JQY8_TRIPS|nr:hypothetical protein T4C_3863 [Trichinella pseudospiralis]
MLMKEYRKQLPGQMVSFAGPEMINPEDVSRKMSPENDLKRKLIAFISSVQSIDTGLKSRFACKMHLLICFFIAFIGCMITSPAFVDAEHADQSQIIDGSRPVANAFASQFEHGIDNRLKRHAIVVIPRPGFGSFSSSEHRSSRLSLLSSH